MKVLIRGGQVVGGGGAMKADVLIADGRIVRIATNIESEDADILEVEGAWVGPGFVDLHAHLREPGQEWKEDIASGSRAAAAGGYTAVVAMPNTTPAIDSGHLARFVSDRGAIAGYARVVPAGSITMNRAGERLSHLDELWQAGVRLFTDDGDTVADAGVMRHAMEYMAHRGGVIAQHAEDPGLARDGHMHEGSISARLGMKGLPAIAEEVVVARDLALVRLTGCRYHVQHVSTSGTVALVQQAKEEGLPVTAEVTPHHLTFSDERVMSMSPDYKMYPPLRADGHVASLRHGLESGVIDAVATDHAPHAEHEQEVPFEEAPRGVIGLETAAAAVNMATVLEPAEFFRRMSKAPARIVGLDDHGVWPAEGGPANLTVFDPNASWVVSGLRSKAQNSPWRGETMRGRVVGTIFQGAVTHRVAEATA